MKPQSFQTKSGSTQIKDYPIFKPDKLENLKWFTTMWHGGGGSLLPIINIAYAFISCNVLHSGFRQSDKHRVTGACLSNNNERGS